MSIIKEISTVIGFLLIIASFVVVIGVYDNREGKTEMEIEKQIKLIESEEGYKDIPKVISEKCQTLVEFYFDNEIKKHEELIGRRLKDTEKKNLKEGLELPRFKLHCIKMDLDKVNVLRGGEK